MIDIEQIIMWTVVINHILQYVEYAIMTLFIMKKAPIKMF
jgi:hypothetical protein